MLVFFFLACDEVGGKFDVPFHACAAFFVLFCLFCFVFVCLFVFCLFVFLKEIRSCATTSLLRPESVHSGSAGLDDCRRAFPDDLHSGFIYLISSHTMPGQQSQPTPTSLGQGRYMRVQL